MEMLAGLSRQKQAYDEMFDYMKHNYEGYDADFIFNPNNYLLRNKLEENQAEFCEEQQTMYFTHVPLDTETDEIRLFSEEYYQQYCAIHDDDGRYWTGEKTSKAPERFHIYLALKDNVVVGYTDVTYTFDENEPIDLFVKEEYRNQGYGRKLLTRALIDNEPKEMVLQVDINNAPAVHLYESLGFRVRENRNMITVHWRKI
jgi:ribosomal protein S18 acetylase RimI-like enzyme